jgi:hypothetical protein
MATQKYKAAFGAFLTLAISGATSLSAGAPAVTVGTAAVLPSNSNGWLETSVGIDSSGSKRTAYAFGSYMEFGAALGDLGKASVAGLDSVLPETTAFYGHWSNDQINVQLAGGDFLLAWNGVSQKPDAALAKTAPWWNQWPLGADNKPNIPSVYGDASTKRAGRRPAILIWRWNSLSDSWGPISALDSAYAGGRNVDGMVHSDQCAQGVPWVAGFDRPELYADPWGAGAGGQRLYLTTACSRPDGDNSEQLFVSSDTGQSWSGSLRLPEGHTAITATPNGRVWMVQYGGGANSQPSVVLYLSNDKGKSLAPNTPADKPFDVGLAQFPATSAGCDVTGIGSPFVYPLGIAAFGPSSVLVAYPSTEMVKIIDSANNTRTVTRQVVVVQLVSTGNAPEADPLVIPLEVIRAKTPEGSVVMSSLNTDSRPSGSPLSLLYWMETTQLSDSPCLKPTTIRARYQVFGLPFLFSHQQGDLSQSDSYIHKPSPVAFDSWNFGDYMKGSSYYDDDAQSLRFVAVWAEERFSPADPVYPFKMKAVANVVSVPSLPVKTAFSVPFRSFTLPGGMTAPHGKSIKSLVDQPARLERETLRPTAAEHESNPRDRRGAP